MSVFRHWQRGLTAGVCVAAAGAVAALVLLGRASPPAVLSADLVPLSSANLELGSRLLMDFKAIRRQTTDSPWVLFHGLVGHGADFEIADADGSGRSCIGWLLEEASWQPRYKGIRIVARGVAGYSFIHAPNPLMRMEFEDHFCQFLFALLLAGADPDKTTIRVPPEGERIPVRRMVADEQSACHGAADVSWAITVFAAWGQSAWTNRFGEPFTLERMLLQHLDREKYSPACFGTHWRMALALAVRDLRGRVGKDVMRRAEARLAEAVDEARSALDAEGQFRLEWGVYPQTPPGFQPPHPMPQDADILLSHQAHMIEWLMVALPDNTLATEDWIHRAVARLCATLGSRTEPVNYGAHSHCAHALRLYRQRVGGLPGFPVAMNEPATAAPPY